MVLAVALAEALLAEAAVESDSAMAVPLVATATELALLLAEELPKLPLFLEEDVESAAAELLPEAIALALALLAALPELLEMAPALATAEAGAPLLVAEAVAVAVAVAVALRRLWPACTKEARTNISDRHVRKDCIDRSKSTWWTLLLSSQMQAIRHDVPSAFMMKKLRLCVILGS